MTPTDHAVAMTSAAATSPQGAATTFRSLLPLVAAGWFLLWVAAWLGAAVLVGAIAGLRPFVVTSGSMQPTIEAGDVVLAASPPDGEVLASPTVITFRDTGAARLVTHRIVGLTGDGRYRTRGDANRVPDSTPVAHGAVEGVGRVLVPMAGLPIVWVHQGAWLPLAGLAGLLAVAVAARRPRPDVSKGQDRSQQGLTRRGAALATITVVILATSVLALAGRSAAAFVETTANELNRWEGGELVAPVNVTATHSCGLLGLNDGIEVDWDPAGDPAVDGYAVHRASTSGGPYTLIATTDATTTAYPDTDVAAGETYYYVVTSTAGDWESPYSSEATETVPLVCL